MQPHSYYVYFMNSASRRALYIGITGKLKRRVWQHKHHQYEGFTADYECTRLVYYETYATVKRAIAREKQLKGWTRKKKEALVTKMNPQWRDLSEGWYERHQFQPQDPSTRSPSKTDGELAQDDSPEMDRSLEDLHHH